MSEHVTPFDIDLDAQTIKLQSAGQSLRFDDLVEDRLGFFYEDAAISLPLMCEGYRFGAKPPWSLVLSLDLNFEEHRLLRTTYGAWRRIVFFLADALPALCHAVFNEDHKFGRLEITGGWQNGAWNARAILQSQERLFSEWPVKVETRLSLPTLSSAPRRWRYHQSQGQDREIELALIEKEGVPVLDASRAIEAQLGDAPYFVTEDKRRFLYVRYVEANLHRGEDYMPELHYGYVDEVLGFTFAATGIGAIGSFMQPFLVDPRASFDDYFTTTAKNERGWFVRPRRGLMERLLFALIDVRAVVPANRLLIKERSGEALDYCRAREPKAFANPDGAVFGQYLNRIDASFGDEFGGDCLICLEHIFGPPIPQK